VGATAGARPARPRVVGAGELSTSELNGTTIAYDAVGSGPAVVLLHAGVGDRRLWDGQVDAFAERHLVVRPDLRGFGESPLPGGPFSYVEDVRALLDHLGLERAAVVGNSHGGRVALDLALAHPDRVRALVLAAANVTGFECSPELDAFDEQEEALLDAGRIEEAVELNLRTWLDGSGRTGAAVSQEVRDRVAGMQRQALETMVAAYERTPPPGPVGWAEPPAAARLRELEVPTLVVVCEHDQPNFRRLSERLATGIPGAERAAMSTGHLPAVEQPEEFNRLVLDFLARVVF
jgi:3-oxoadipate enol-lactonase